MSHKVTATPVTQTVHQITTSALAPALTFAPYVNGPAGATLPDGSPNTHRGPGPFRNRWVPQNLGGNVRVILELDGNHGDGPVSAPFTITGGQAGVHYNLLTPSPLTIPQGQTQADIQLQILDDGLFHEEQELQIQLGTPTGARLGSTWKTLFRLNIYSTNTPETVKFAAASSTRNWNATPASAQIDLSGLVGDDVSVYYRVLDTSTADPNDYTITADPVVISEGSLLAYLQVTWTGANPGLGITDTIDVEIVNDTRGQTNFWTFSDTMHEPEGPLYPTDAIGGTLTFEEARAYAAYPTDTLYKDLNPQNGGWACEYPVPTEGVSPDGRTSGYRYGLSGSAQGTAKIAKTFTAGQADWSYDEDGNGTAGGGVSVGGTDQLIAIRSDATCFSMYVKQPTLAAHRSARFSLTIYDRILQNSHKAEFEWSGTGAGDAPTLVGTEKLDTGNGDAAGIDTAAAYAHTDEANGWHRVYVAYTGTSVANTTKGVGSGGDIGHVTNRFAAFWEQNGQSVDEHRGEGVVMAWPQLEFGVTTPSAYQHEPRQWGEPWGNARALNGGQLTHTFNIQGT